MEHHEVEVDAAALRLAVAPAAFRKCAPSQANDVVRLAKAQFVEGDPRAWWLSLKQPFENYPYRADEWPVCVARSVPHGTLSCWLILESDSSEHPVYWGRVDEVLRVLAECSFFEYYLVSERGDWLVADTDHNQLVVARRPKSHPLES